MPSKEEAVYGLGVRFKALSSFTAKEKEVKKASALRKLVNMGYSLNGLLPAKGCELWVLVDDNGIYCDISLLVSRSTREYRKATAAEVVILC